MNEKEDLVDIIVQEKNITFPTVTKLHKKIIEECKKISKKENIKLRKGYKRVINQLMIDQRSREYFLRCKKEISAERKLKTITSRLLREVEHGPYDIDRLSAFS